MTDRDSPPWEQIGYLTGMIRGAIDLYDRGLPRLARETLAKVLEDLAQPANRR